jgi:hypothetical protein
MPVKVHWFASRPTEETGMHFFKSSIAIVPTAASAHVALAQPTSETCEGKRADIRRNIEIAKAKGRIQRVRGLETALRETEAKCSGGRTRQAAQQRSLSRLV